MILNDQATDPIDRIDSFELFEMFEIFDRINIELKFW